MKIYDAHAHIFIKGAIPEAYLNGMARTMKMVVRAGRNGCQYRGVWSTGSRIDGRRI